MGTDGGQYKWSATIQTGKVPDLDNSTDLSSNVTAYANNNMFKLPNQNHKKITKIILFHEIRRIIAKNFTHELT